MISPRISLVVLFLILGLGNSVRVLAADAPAAQQTPLPVALVDALNKLSNGPHKGFRANHAKGVMVEGTFTPSPSAASFSKAPHFAKSVPVLVRFSDTTGVPTLPDADPNASAITRELKLISGQERPGVLKLGSISIGMAADGQQLGVMCCVDQLNRQPTSLLRTSGGWR